MLSNSRRLWHNTVGLFLLERTKYLPPPASLTFWKATHHYIRLQLLKRFKQQARYHFLVFYLFIFVLWRYQHSVQQAIPSWVQDCIWAKSKTYVLKDKIYLKENKRKSGMTTVQIFRAACGQPLRIRSTSKDLKSCEGWTMLKRFVSSNQ